MRCTIFACFYLLFLDTNTAQQQMGSYMAYGPEAKYFSNLNYRVYQSKNGYLWFGTLNGLVRFDGKRYKNYFSNYADPNSPTDNNIFDITADKNEDLWFAGFYHGATKYNQQTGKFTKYLALTKDNNPSYGINRIVSDADGDLWFATSGRGLAKYDFEKDSFDLYFPEPDKCRDGTVWRYNYIYDIQQDTRDHKIFWVGTFNGLYSFNKEKKTFLHFPYPVNRNMLPGQMNIITVEQDKKGLIWLGSWGGEYPLKCFDKRTKTFTPGKTEKKVLIVYDLKSVNDSIIYAACLNAGVYQLNTNTGVFTNITPPRNPADPTAKLPDIQKISVTPDAGIFIGGNYYVYQQHPAFTRLLPNISYPFSKKKVGYISLNSVVWDEKRQHFWLACTDGDGLYTLNKDANRIEPLAYAAVIHYGNEYFHDLVIDALNRVWVINQYYYKVSNYSEQHYEIMLWNDQKKVFAKQSGIIPLPDTEIKRIQRLESNKDGDLWMITDSSFIFWNIKKNTAETYPVTWGDNYNGSHNMGWRELQADPEGNAWLFTSVGMFYCNRQQKKVKHIFKTGTGKTSLASQIIKSAAFGKNDELWITSGDGIQVYNWKQDSVITNHSIGSGLPTMAVNSIEIDTSGCIWAGTSSGLCLFDPSKKIWRPFNRMDGLERDYLDAGIFITANNKIVIDQVNNFLIKDINELLAPSQPPVLRLTSVFINHREHTDSLLPECISQLVLSYDKNNIDIEFAAMDWLYPSKTNYQYKIEGLPAVSAWAPNPDCRISLVALHPGRYILHIRALNSNGIWSKEIIFPITITPPFWKTTWFIIICILAMLALLYAVYRYRIGQFLKMQQIRNSISRDLHDEIGATLSSVNMLSAVALLKAGDKNEATPLIQQIKNSVQQAGESIDDIVWSVNPANDPAQDTFARIRKYVSELVEAKGLNCNIEIDEPGISLNLPMEVRRDIYMVCKEAVNNALKYSGCTTISVSIRLKNHHLIMTIADDGMGFAPTILSTSLRNGIGNMRHRIEKHKGIFELASTKGKGTTIVCKVQL